MDSTSFFLVVQVVLSSESVSTKYFGLLPFIIFFEIVKLLAHLKLPSSACVLLPIYSEISLISDNEEGCCNEYSLQLLHLYKRVNTAYSKTLF